MELASQSQNPNERELAKLRRENALLRSLCGSWLLDVDDELLPRFIVKPGSLDGFNAKYDVRIGDWHDLSNVEKHTLMPLDFEYRRDVRVLIVTRKQEPTATPSCALFAENSLPPSDRSGYQVASLVGKENWIPTPTFSTPILVCA